MSNFLSESKIENVIKIANIMKLMMTNKKGVNL